MEGPGSAPPPSDTLGPAIIRVVVAFTVLSGIGILLRCLTRFFLVKRAGADDALILVAFAWACALSALTCEQVRYGLGKHIWNVNPTFTTTSVKLAFWGIIVYNMALTFTKLSLLTQYLRIAVEKVHRKIIFGMMVVVVAYGIELLFAGTFTCVPVNAFWDFSVKGKCLPKKPLWYANAALNIATDFVIFILPIPVIRDLNLPKQQRIGLCLVFAIGFFTCIVSIIRLATLVQSQDSQDMTHDNAPSGTWSLIEVHTGIFCACASTLKPLISKAAPNLLATLRSRTSSYGGKKSYQLSGRSGQSEPYKKGILSKKQTSSSNDTADHPLQPLKSEDGQRHSYTVHEREIDIESQEQNRDAYHASWSSSPSREESGDIADHYGNHGAQFGAQAR